MDLTALRYLEAVSRHGSLSSAARALKVAQPTLLAGARSFLKWCLASSGDASFIPELQQ